MDRCRQIGRHRRIEPDQREIPGGIVVAIAFFVTEGVVTREGDVIWGVLLVYAAGTFALGAWPALRRHR